MEWTLEKIRAVVRKLTGRPSTVQLSEADLDDYINDYYQNTLPDELKLRNLDEWFSFSTVAGTGEYSVDPSDVRILFFPITVDDAPISLSHDPALFFLSFPRDQETSDYYAEPTNALFHGGELYLRPVPDDVYTVKYGGEGRPEALSAGEEPIVRQWGQLIAYGAARDILMQGGDFELLSKISIGYQVHLDLTFSRQARSYVGARSVPRF